MTRFPNRRLVLILILLVLLPAGLCALSTGTPDSGGDWTAAPSETPVEDREPAEAATARSVSASAAPTASGLQVSVQTVNSWQEGSTAFAQYALSLFGGSAAVSSWQLQLDCPAGMAVSQFWNCTAVQSGTALTLTAMDYNRIVPAGGTVSDIGIILSGAGAPASITLTAALSDGTTTTEVFSFNAAAETAPSPSSPASETTETETETAVSATVIPAGTILPLHVEGTHLADPDGNAVQLRGVSTHGIAWFPQYVSEETFRTLRDDWGVNAIRLALYTEEYGGYCSGGNQEELKALVDKGVQAATKLGLYVIIDWHILQDGDPRTHQAEAVAFFSEMSRKYAGQDNVLYELCNEPQNAPWESVIRPYAETVLAAIRKNDPDALVIVGTNTWSQDVGAVAGKQLADKNVLYAFHFYAATHGESLRQQLTAALDAGIPVFVSECGISEASGGGQVDTASADAWLELLNRYGVSFMAWGLSNKAETVSLLQSDCSKISGWTDADLTESGLWFRSAIRSGRTEDTVQDPVGQVSQSDSQQDTGENIRGPVDEHVQSGEGCQHGYCQGGTPYPGA